MSTEENKAIIRRFLDELWNKGNLAIVDEVVASNWTGHSNLPGMSSSREAARAAVTSTRTAFPDMHVTFDDLIAEEDRVVLRSTTHGTHQGPLVGIPPTGKQVTMSGIAIYRLVDGKIVEQWGVNDMLGLLQQLGVVPILGQSS